MGHSFGSLDELGDGYGFRKGQRYFALNLLSELDTPGEWFLSSILRL